MLIKIIYTDYTDETIYVYFIDTDFPNSNISIHNNIQLSDHFPITVLLLLSQPEKNDCKVTRLFY